MNSFYWISRFEKQLYSFQYKPASIKVYSNALHIYLKAADHYGKHPFLMLEPEIVKELTAIFKNRALSYSYQKTILCSVRRFYALVLHRELKIKNELICRKKAFAFPRFLSRENIKNLLAVTSNLKHKLVIGLLYSAGLRLRELLALKVKDIDMPSGLITVAGENNMPPRRIALSQAVCQYLEAYFPVYRPSLYVLEHSREKPYSKRSVETVIRRSAQKCDIAGRVSPQILRHSFAVHLIEDGISLPALQLLLGHRSLHSTERYKTVARKTLRQAGHSPMDGFMS